MKLGKGHPIRISAARLLACEVLLDVELKGEYSNIALPRALRTSDLSIQDRSLVTEMVYGSLRMRGQIDYYLSRIVDRSLVELDPPLLILLRLGFYQIHFMRIPDYAAVSETVNLAKKIVGESSASLVNAVLRKAPSLTLELPTDEIAALAIETSHPEWIVSAYIDSLESKDEIRSALLANNKPAQPTILPWPGLSTVAELEEAGGEPILGSLRAFSLQGDPGNILAIRERRAGVQDWGSQQIVESFFSTNTEGNLRWLDLCAGPGGKAAYLDALLQTDSFIANEVSLHRSELLSQVMHWGRVTNYDARKLPDDFGTFDRILLDVPCSGIGALRRRPDLRWRRTLQDLPSLLTLQSEILDSAVKVLNPGGIIAYVTCSPHIAETRWQIRKFLKRHPNFKRISNQDPRANNEGDLQLWTHRDGTDAMFLSLLRRER